MPPIYYDTLVQAVEDLKKKGYDQDLNFQKEGIECKALSYQLSPKDFEVDQVHRFEGMTNPDDASVLYAISSDKYEIKGILIDAYGAYADPLTSDMIKKLKYEPN